MDWIIDLFLTDSVAHAILILSLVTAVGLGLGSLRVRGLGLGTVGVLFSGLIFGHFGITINHEILDYTREFGLILFVYTIGMQVGPGFFAAFKKQGLTLNLLAFSIVFLGFLTVLGVHFFGGIPMTAAVGLFSGGTTNTPSLAATIQALSEVAGLSQDLLKMPSMAYAVAYPFGIIGIILSMLLIKAYFKVSPTDEAKQFIQEQKAENTPLESMNIRVMNQNLDGLTVAELPFLKESGLVISRHFHEDTVTLAGADSKIAMGDILRVVGSKDGVRQFQMMAGEESDTDIKQFSSNLASQQVVLTRSEVAGKSLRELQLHERYGVQVVRVTRGGVKLASSPSLNLQIGDIVQAVGAPADLERFGKVLGNSIKELNFPQIVPIFVGIALGVLLGCWPFYLPGVPAAVKLGVAGGPLLVALVLSKVGNLGTMNWYLHPSSNFILRETGIVMFLACVGLHGGDQFVETLLNGPGMYWMAMASLITLLPLIIVGFVARGVFKLNYAVVSGLLAGSMTDPPALNFATTITKSDAPSISYATVYPLVMILRIIAAQLLVLFWV